MICPGSCTVGVGAANSGVESEPYPGLPSVSQPARPIASKPASNTFLPRPTRIYNAPRANAALHRPWLPFALNRTITGRRLGEMLTGRREAARACRACHTRSGRRRNAYDFDLRRFGTFRPFLRASERPIAIACLRLVTFFPLRPLRSVPRLRIARATSLEALREYRRAILLFP